MSSEFGKNIRVTLFGESHSAAMGAVIDGFPAGITIDTERIIKFMARRAPGKNDYSTTRREDDSFTVLSGIVNSVTTGTPISFSIANKDAQSTDYKEIKATPRPSHADYPAIVKYGEAHDIRGGGHFSGRLTAPLCLAGALCIQLLEKYGASVGAHILSVGSRQDEAFGSVNITESEMKAVADKAFPVINDDAGKLMVEKIIEAKKAGDSVGGVVECCVLGVPAGMGEPIFDGIENKISSAVFGIPAVKAIEFGEGFTAARLRGSENNDSFCFADGKVATRTNRSGGILGGMSTGMPIIFRAAFKPTPTIALEQQTVNLDTGEEVKAAFGGRHDPCIVPRAVPCVEAAAAIAVADLITEGRRYADR